MASFDKASDQAAESNKDFSTNATTAAKSAENLSGKAGSASEKVRQLAVVTEDAGEAMQTAAKTAADYAKQAEEARKKSKSLADTIAEQKRITLEFQRELDAVNKRLKSLPAGSTGFIQLTKRANELKEAIIDNKDALKELNLDKTDADKAAKEFEGLAKGLTKLTGSTKSATSSSVELLDKTGLLPAQFTKIAAGVRSLATVITSQMAIATAGISLVIAAIVALGTAFFKSEEGSKTLAKVTSVLGALFNALFGVVQDVSLALFDAFSNPQEAVTKLWELIKENIVNRITGLADQFKFLGEIIAGVFTLDSDRITTGVKNFGEATTRVLTGVEDLAGKVADGYDKIATATDKAYKAGLRIAEIDKTLKNLRLERVSNEGRITRELAEQENIAGNVLKSSAERNAAAEKFKALNKELTSFEQRRLDLEIEKLQLSKEESQRTTEEKIAIQELIGEKEEALAREIKANEDVSRTIQSLNKADAQRAQAANDKAIAEAEAEAERLRQAREQADQQAAAKRAELAAEQLTLQQGVNDRLDELQQQRELSQLSAGDRAIEEARIRANKEVEVAALAYDRLVELAAGNAERIAEIRAQEAISTGLIEQNLSDQIAAIRTKSAEDEALRLEEEQKKRIEVLTGAADQLNGVIQGAAAGQIKSAEEAGKAIIGIALEILEKQALLAITNATIGSLATPQSIATGGTLGIAQAAILTALIKAALAGVRGALAGSFYEGGIVGQDGGVRMHGGRDGYLARVHKGEHIMPTVETNKYMPYLEMMRGGKFEEWVAGMQNATAQGGYKDIKVSGFNDRKLVGAMGSVGSLSEQRKQTELLASLNRRMGRRGNKRYVA